MKICKKLISIIMTISIVVFSPCITSAKTIKNDIVTKEYEEYHDQINFEDLVLISVNKNSLVATVDSTVSLFKRISANKQKEKLDNYLKKYPEAIEELLNALEIGDQICAISYTEAPLKKVDDHFERIPKKEKKYTSFFGINAFAEDITASSNSSTRHSLTLKTTIIRRGYSNPYYYHASTTGVWKNATSVFNGEKYPAGGNDFVLQACPAVVHNTGFSSTYNHSTDGSTSGQEGKNFFRTDGNDSWVKYEVVDDPVGLAQLSSFSLGQSFKAKTSTSTKRINSYYIHTWKQISATVSVNGKAGASGGTPTAEVSLTITPSISSAQWQLHDFVAYNW